MARHRRSSGVEVEVALQRSRYAAPRLSGTWLGLELGEVGRLAPASASAITAASTTDAVELGQRAGGGALVRSSGGIDRTTSIAWTNAFNMNPTRGTVEVVDDPQDRLLG